MQINFWDYIAGYVTFKTEGGFPERFINLCAKNGIFIRDVKIKNGRLSGAMGIESYKKIRPYARKSGVKIRIEKKVGLPFFLHKKRNRFALPVCLLVFIITVCTLSNFVWTVDVKGNKKIPSEDIIQSFSELGVKPGVLKKKIEASRIAEESLLKIDGISWASVNLMGCNAQIEVKEKIDTPMINNKNTTPQNIVADKPAIIRSVNLYSGTLCVDLGSAVEKGDVIVTGAKNNQDGSVKFESADALIIGETEVKIKSSIPQTQMCRVYGKIRKRYSLYFFGINIPLNFVKNENTSCDYFLHEDFLEANGVKLPLGVFTEYFSFYKKQERKMDKKLCELRCAEEYLYKFKNEISDKEILSEKVKSSDFSQKGVYRCLQQIGETEKMDLDVTFREDNEKTIENE